MNLAKIADSMLSNSVYHIPFHSYDCQENILNLLHLKRKHIKLAYELCVTQPIKPNIVKMKACPCLVSHVQYL